MSGRMHRLRVELQGYLPVERGVRYDAAGDARLPIALTERQRVPEAFFPTAPEQAKEVQAATAEALELPVEVANSIGVKLRLTPADEFLMGSPGSEKDRCSDDGPQHRVRITRPFYLGVYEVTRAEYEQVMGVNPSAFSAKGKEAARVKGLDTSRHPVGKGAWARCSRPGTGIWPVWWP